MKRRQHKFWATAWRRQTWSEPLAAGLLPLAVAIGADLLIPMHFGQHEINTERPGNLVDYLQQRYRYQKCHAMVPGERFVYVK